MKKKGLEQDVPPEKSIQTSPYCLLVLQYTEDETTPTCYWKAAVFLIIHNVKPQYK